MSFASCIRILVIPYRYLPKHKLHQCLCTKFDEVSAYTYHKGMFVRACNFCDANFFYLKKDHLGIKVLFRLDRLLLEQLLLILLLLVVLLSLSFLSLTIVRVHGGVKAEKR